MFKVLSTPQLSAKKCKWISASRSLSKKGGRVDFWSQAREGGGNQMHLGKKNGAKGGEGEWEKSKSNRTLYIPVSILRQKICKHKAGNKRTNEKKDQV